LIWNAVDQIWQWRPRISWNTCTVMWIFGWTKIAWGLWRLNFIGKRLQPEFTMKHHQGIKDGVFDVLPSYALDGLTAEDLRLLLCGTAKIDVGVLQSYASFADESSAPSDQLAKFKKWFWSVVRKMSDKEKQVKLFFRLNVFLTYCSRISIFFVHCVMLVCSLLFHVVNLWFFCSKINFEKRKNWLPPRTWSTFGPARPGCRPARPASSRCPAWWSAPPTTCTCPRPTRASRASTCRSTRTSTSCATSCSSPSRRACLALSETMDLILQHSWLGFCVTVAKSLWINFCYFGLAGCFLVHVLYVCLKCNDIGYFGTYPETSKNLLYVRYSILYNSSAKSILQLCY